MEMLCGCLKILEKDLKVLEEKTNNPFLTSYPLSDLGQEAYAKYMAYEKAYALYEEKYY